jgi:hypothetical protein
MMTTSNVKTIPEITAARTGQSKVVSRVATRCVCVMAIVVLVGAPAANAQDVDVAGGYGYAAIRHEFDWKNYQGFWLDTSVYVRPQFALVAEFDRLVFDSAAVRTSISVERYRSERSAISR